MACDGDSASSRGVACADAVRSGRISESRIDASVRRLLSAKARLKLHTNRFVDESRVSQLVGTPDHLAIAQEVADRSLTLLKNDGVLPIAQGRMGAVVNINIQKEDTHPSPSVLSAHLAAELPSVQNFTLRPDMNPSVYDAAWQAIAESDLVILSFFVQRTKTEDATPIREGDLDFLEKIITAKPGAVVAMAYGNPHLIRKIPAVAAFLVGFSERGWFGNQEVYFDSFVKVLTGEIVPSGKLPVRVSEAYPIGSGLSY